MKSGSCDINLLYVISQNGHIEIVQLLLKAGAGVDVQALNGVTALMLAVYNNNAVVTQMLLDADADIDVAANNGATAQLVASKLGFEDLSALLQESKHREVPINQQ